MYQFVWAARVSGCVRWLAMLAAFFLGLSLAWAGNAPEPLAGRKWVAQASGARHSLGVDAAGQVWAWGDNSSGQLGLGHTRPVTEVAQVTGLAGRALAVSAGTQHSAVLLADGTVWVWGANNRGQLGRNPIDLFRVQSTPVQVAGLTGVVGLSGGDDFVLALTGSRGKGGKAKKETKKTVLRWGAGDAEPSPVTGLKVLVAEIKPTKAIPASPEKPIQTAAPVLSAPPVLSALPVRVVPSTVRPELVEGLRQAQPERVMAQPSASSSPSSSTPVAATPPAPTSVNVSGVVRLSSGFAGAGSAATGEALANVQLTADGAQCAPTDNQGRYVCSMPSGWSGRIRVSRNNYQFSPNTLSFSNLRFDAGQQNFAAIYDPR